MPPRRTLIVVGADGSTTTRVLPATTANKPHSQRSPTACAAVPRNEATSPGTSTVPSLPVPRPRTTVVPSPSHRSGAPLHFPKPKDPLEETKQLAAPPPPLPPTSSSGVAGAAPPDPAVTAAVESSAPLVSTTIDAEHSGEGGSHEQRMVWHGAAPIRPCSSRGLENTESMDAPVLGRLLEQLQQRPEDTEVFCDSVQWIRGHLEAVVQTIVKTATVECIGSAVTGFLDQASDIDLTVTGLPPKYADQENPQHVHNLLHDVTRALQTGSKGFIDRPTLVLRARVPLLRCAVTIKAGHEREVDLSVANERAVHRSHLLRGYARCQPMLRSLVVLVKAWQTSEQYDMCVVLHSVLT